MGTLAIVGNPRSLPDVQTLHGGRASRKGGRLLGTRRWACLASKPGVVSYNVHICGIKRKNASEKTQNTGAGPKHADESTPATSAGDYRSAINHHPGCCQVGNRPHKAL